MENINSNFDYCKALSHRRKNVDFKIGDEVICSGKWIGTILMIDDSYNRKGDIYNKFKTYIVSDLKDRNGELYSDFQAAVFYQKNLMFKDDYNYFVIHYNMFETTLSKFEKENFFIPFMQHNLMFDANIPNGRTIYSEKQEIMEYWK